MLKKAFKILKDLTTYRKIILSPVEKNDTPEILTDDRDYSELIRNLALPTPQQTINFMNYLSTDHSWYKNIGMQNQRDFVFYLDPNAGRSLIYPEDKNKPLIFIPLKEGKHKPSYGGWMYYTTGYTVNYLTNSDGTVNDSRPYIGLNIVNEEGLLVPIPEEVILAGTIPLSGFLHGGLSAAREHLVTMNRLQKHLENLLIFYHNYLLGTGDSKGTNPE